MLFRSGRGCWLTGRATARRPRASGASAPSLIAAAPALFISSAKADLDGLDLAGVPFEVERPARTATRQADERAGRQASSAEHPALGRENLDRQKQHAAPIGGLVRVLFPRSQSLRVTWS